MASRVRGLLLTAACLSFALGCGARTDTLFDDGYGGSSGGTVGFAGGQGHGGTFNPVAGGPSFGGTVGASGTFGTGGTFGAAGTFGNAGNVGVSGTFGFAGSSFGGAFPAGGDSGISGSTSTGGFSTGGVGTAGTTSLGGSGAVGGSGGIVNLCLATVQNACDKCLCSSCASELDSCFTEVGCALIFACVQEKQCQLFGCYQASTCRGVIDEFGGPTGSSVQQVFSLVSCAAQQATNCNCN
jgi:hypothetical protein